MLSCVREVKISRILSFSLSKYVHSSSMVKKKNIGLIALIPPLDPLKGAFIKQLENTLKQK